MAKRQNKRRNTRKNTRKNNRKNTRKNRRANRKNTRRYNRRAYMMGGAANSMDVPAPVGYGLAQTPEARMSLAQGGQFLSYHTNQHGGQAPYPQQVVGSTLPSELHPSARILPLDGYFNDIRGLKDPNQMGAGRRRNRKNNRRNTRRRRNMKGGAATYNYNPASTSAPGLLLDPAMEARAVRGMNPEWYLATDPNSFTPKS